MDEVAVWGDSETVRGMAIAGIAKDENLIEEEYSASTEQLSVKFDEISSRDLGVILVCDFIAEKINHLIDINKLPTVLVIPSKKRK